MHRLGLPTDAAPLVALALVPAVILGRTFLFRPRTRAWIVALLLGAVAAALSVAYVAHYLRGGPRIIDATSYYLEARALAHGLLAFPLPDPETSVLGRFMVRSQSTEGVAAVIFPPGYPAVLALGFLVGAPLAVGPVLAFALTLVTFDLARSIARALPPPVGAIGPFRGPSVAPTLAACLSVVCAALRYHTADTMSHGLAALCVSAAIACTLRALDAQAATQRTALAALAGVFAGWLCATRPMSALALFVALLISLLGRRRSETPRRFGSWSSCVSFALGTLPGVVVLLLHQHAATGAWLVSSQRAYYEVSDGPPGCFRLGFGHQIGCLGEHGDFVARHLLGGFGLAEAIGTTLRRLNAHLVDAANLDPLALLIPLGAVVLWRNPQGRVLPVAILAQILAYAPFYFEGSYPGGGARLFADILPLEHVLMAFAVVSIAGSRRLHLSAETCAAFCVGLALAGFGVQSSFDHGALRDRDGGLPMFEASRLAAKVGRGALLFFDTDHGLNLALDPTPVGAPFLARRFHGDALDRFAWEAAGRPEALRYRFDLRGESLPHLDPMSFPVVEMDTIEGESLWPPRSQAGGWALPEWAAGTCASGSRWLEVHVGEGALQATITLGLPMSAAVYSLAPRLAWRGEARGHLTVRARHGLGVAKGPVTSRGTSVMASEREEAHSIPFALRSDRPEFECVSLQSIRLRNDTGGAPTSPPSEPWGAIELTIDFEKPTASSRLALDAIELRRPENN